MRKLLWIGSYMDAETETYLKETILYKKPSTSLSQRNILVGIEQNMGQQFDCVGAVSMHGFPRDKSIRVPAVSFQRPGGRTAMLVGFLNPMYANKLLMASSLKCAVKKWVKQNSGDDGLDIFVYEARSACLAAAVWIKKRIPGTRIHLIVPDIPQYMDLHMSGLKRVLKRLDWNTIKRYFLKIDRFIVYTEAMVDALGIRNRPWMRMEGSIPLFQEVHRPMLESAAEEAACIIMYSGSINLKFGIGNLIQAMDMLGSRYTLWLTGMGPDAEAVREAAEKRDNIQFF